MILHFPYQAQPIAGFAPPSLTAGTRHRWRPFLPVTIRSLQTGRTQTIQRAVADTGADDTIFPLQLAPNLGVTLIVGPQSTTIRWRGTTYPMQYGRVELELRAGLRCFSWQAIVAFSPALIPYPLLGQAGCLQFFNADFRGEDCVLGLEPVRSFPGTVT